MSNGLRSCSIQLIPSSSRKPQRKTSLGRRDQTLEVQLCGRELFAGPNLTCAMNLKLEPNLTPRTGSMEFKFSSVPRVPKHLRPQCQDSGQCFLTWCVLRAIAQPEYYSYNDRSKTLWCGGSYGCHRPLEPDQFLQSSHSVFVRTV